jgi:hypothetical protein
MPTSSQSSGLQKARRDRIRCRPTPSCAPDARRGLGIFLRLGEFRRSSSVPDNLYARWTFTPAPITIH